MELVSSARVGGGQRGGRHSLQIKMCCGKCFKITLMILRASISRALSDLYQKRIFQRSLNVLERRP